MDELDVVKQALANGIGKRWLVDHRRQGFFHTGVSATHRWQTASAAPIAVCDGHKLLRKV